MKPATPINWRWFDAMYPHRSGAMPTSAWKLVARVDTKGGRRLEDFAIVFWTGVSTWWWVYAEGGYFDFAGFLGTAEAPQPQGPFASSAEAKANAIGACEALLRLGAAP